MHGDRHSMIRGPLPCLVGLCAVLYASSAILAQDPPAASPSPAPTVAPVEPPASPSPAPAVTPAQPPTSPATPATPAPPASAPPIAIVPLDQSVRGAALSVSGSMQARNGRAYLSGSGNVTAGSTAAVVALPYRGTLRVCSSTSVTLAVDNSAPPGGLAGLLMAIDHGAVEMSFAATPRDANTDTLMTPDFRILIGGPGASEVKVRLGPQGDTCVDNSGSDGPYVVVSSLFDTGLYRVQPGQRVSFQHGSVREVNDQEKEPCGCPPDPEKATGNEFPLAQSEGLAPLQPAPAPPKSDQAAKGNIVPPLVYTGKTEHEPPAVAPTTTAPAPVASPQPAPQAKTKKPGVFRRVGHFFRRVFGAE